jgi:DNA-binding TFAR19-related protein (PDSD5 family)
LVELVKKSLESQDMKNKLSISLTPEAISVISNIVSVTPNILNDIESSVKEVIKDGKIDSSDVPNLIVIVQKLYQVVLSLKATKIDSEKRADIAASLLKYIINILVAEGIIKIDQEKQPEFFAQINILIDSCFSLLSFSKSIKTKGCFKKIFG